MQATVHDFDPDTVSGNLLSDEGVLIPFDADAFANSHLRILRPGQRLIVTVQGQGRSARAVAFRLENVGVVPAP